VCECERGSPELEATERAGDFEDLHDGVDREHRYHDDCIPRGAVSTFDETARV